MGFIPYRKLVKRKVKCIYLGEPKKDKSGVAVKVKCNCGSNTSIYHEEHICMKYGRCLPTMDRKFDEEHQLEAQLFRICKFCEENKNVNS